MTDMHPYEALKIALQEARDERDDWRESATRAAGESCGDERHCTCVGPLRKELRDAKAKLAALVTCAMSAETILANMAKEKDTGRFFGRWEINHEPLRNDAQRMLPSFREALAAAKVQP